MTKRGIELSINMNFRSGLLTCGVPKLLAWARKHCLTPGPSPPHLSRASSSSPFSLSAFQLLNFPLSPEPLSLHPPLVLRLGRIRGHPALHVVLPGSTLGTLPRKVHPCLCQERHLSSAFSPRSGHPSPLRQFTPSPSHHRLCRNRSRLRSSRSPFLCPDHPPSLHESPPLPRSQHTHFGLSPRH